MSLSDHLMHMAQAIKLFSEHAQKLGPDSLDDEITKAVLESGKSLLGYTTTEDISTDAEVHLSQVGKLQSLSQDLFWELPEQLKFVEAVEAAFYARKELIKEANQRQHFNDLHSATEIGGTSKSVVSLNFVLTYVFLLTHFLFLIQIHVHTNSSIFHVSLQFLEQGTSMFL